MRSGLLIYCRSSKPIKQRASPRGPAPCQPTSRASGGLLRPGLCAAPLATARVRNLWQFLGFFSVRKLSVLSHVSFSLDRESSAYPPSSKPPVWGHRGLRLFRGSRVVRRINRAVGEGIGDYTDCCAAGWRAASGVTGCTKTCFTSGWACFTSARIFSTSWVSSAAGRSGANSMGSTSRISWGLR